MHPETSNAILVGNNKVFPSKSSVNTNKGDSEKNGDSKKIATTPNE